MSKIPRMLLVVFIVVMANYVAQIPYDLHLYGGNVNPRGVLLLGLTFLWFVVGFRLLMQGNRTGYWLTLAFVVVQFVFYFNNEIVLMIYGYGLIYHLLNLKDMVIWVVELIGDLNFIVAGYSIYYLLRNRAYLVHLPRQIEG